MSVVPVSFETEGPLRRRPYLSRVSPSWRVVFVSGRDWGHGKEAIVRVPLRVLILFLYLTLVQTRLYQTTGGIQEARRFRSRFLDRGGRVGQLSNIRLPRQILGTALHQVRGLEAVDATSDGQSGRATLRAAETR